MNNSKRHALFHVNRFQKMLFFPVVLAFIVGCCVAWLSIVYALIGPYLMGPQADGFRKFIPALLALAGGLMVVMVFWTLRISGRYLGAYDRILRELDDVLAGNRKGPLKVRNDDSMFEELLKRVNCLIEKTG